jgi:tRNA 2-selenouridine synthase
VSKVALPLTNDYLNLLLDGVPMIDVRAPIESQTGTLPFATNLPLMTDEERHEVGICYKERGQKEAIALGHELVCGVNKQARVDAWQTFFKSHPSAVLYCARGGLRSQLSQQWLADAGIDCPRVEGGYKRLRGFLIEQLNQACKTEKLVLLSGMTGTGKTDIIKTLPRSINLEGAANHKGSSFGRPLNEQPAQIDFENKVILDLMAVRHQHPERSIIVEDESRNIGGRHLPIPLSDAMVTSPMVVIELPFEQRIEKLWREYVIERYQDTLIYHGNNAEQAFADYLRDSLLRLKKRLGGQKTKEILELMDSALLQQHSDDFTSHRYWLQAITADYYDPMYLYQLEKRNDRVVFKGNHPEVTQWLESC